MRLFVLLCLLLLSLSAIHAQGDIHRCLGADGIPVFTDRVCSDIHATPVMPAPAAAVAHAAMDLSSPPAVLCAADLAQLKQAVIDAFAARNPNRLAGLTLWNGDGQATVVADIRFFNRLMAHPLIQVKMLSPTASDDDDDTDIPAPSTSTQPSSPHAAEALLVQTEAGDSGEGTEATRFDVIHHDGCLWLRPRE